MQVGETYFAIMRSRAGPLSNTRGCDGMKGRMLVISQRVELSNHSRLGRKSYLGQLTWRTRELRTAAVSNGLGAALSGMLKTWPCQ